MRQSHGFYISLVAHVLFFVVAVVWGNGSYVNVDLDRPMYTVDLVSLGSPGKSGKPAKANKPKAPKPEVKPEPKPEPVPESKPEPKPEPKDISPKKVEKPVIKKPEPKPEPKPQKSASQLISEGLKDVRNQVKAQDNKKQQALADEMASLRESVGDEVYDDAADGEGGGGTGIGSGLSEVYALIVGAAIKKNWRYPSFAGDTNIRATVEIELSADGRILSSKLVESSGVAEFDNSTARAVKETEFVEPPRTERDKIIRINFNSQELGE